MEILGGRTVMLEVISRRVSLCVASVLRRPSGLPSFVADRACNPLSPLLSPVLVSDACDFCAEGDVAIGFGRRKAICDHHHRQANFVHRLVSAGPLRNVSDVNRPEWSNGVLSTERSWSPSSEGRCAMRLSPSFVRYSDGCADEAAVEGVRSSQSSSILSPLSVNKASIKNPRRSCAE
jgi:hypothetical protein